MTGCGLRGPGRRGGRRALAVPLAAVLAAVLAVLGAAAGPSARAQAAPPAPRVLAWGYNLHGQLGDGTIDNRDTPVVTDLPGGVRVTAIAGGDYHSLALTSGGRVYAWGYNGSGQLGDGTFTDRHRPVAVTGLPAGVPVTAIAGGGYHSLALTSGGQVYAWGNNTRGQLGDGTIDTRSRPVRVDLPAGVRVTAIAAGVYFNLALTSGGQVYAWGSNSSGQLGDGTFTDRHRPVPVEGLPAGVRVTAIAAGDYHSLALTSGGRVYAWGADTRGQLGDGIMENRETPVMTSLPAAVRVTAIAAGGYHSLALTSGGRVYAWGYNGRGEIGDGTTEIRSTPVATDLPAGVRVTAIAAGRLHSLALTAGGPLYAWGDNEFGQLGDGTAIDRHKPVPVDPPVTEIAAGRDHSLALEEGPLAEIAKTGPESFDHAGQTLTYVYVVRNLGSVPLHAVTLTDSRAGHVTCPDSLPLDAVRTCTATYPVTADDAARGEVLNTATLAGRTPAGTPVSFGSNRVTVPLQHRPYAQVAKTGPESFDHAGQTLTYLYVIRNLGNVPLHAVTLTDSRAGRVTCPASLPLDAVRTCTATYTVTRGDAAARQVLNTAILAGRTPAGTPVSFGSNQAIVPLQHRPYAQVAKTGPESFDHAGQTLTYVYVIRNLGNVPLHAVTLTDSRAGHVTCPDSLPLDAVRTCTATYTVTRGDAAARQVLNTAILAGRTPAGTPVSFGSNQAIVPLQATTVVPVTG